MDPQLRPLKDKLRDHWYDRNFTMKPENAGQVAMTSFWVFTVTLFYTSVRIIIPTVSRWEYNQLFWLKTLAWFLLIECLVNWFLTAVKPLSQNRAEKVAAEIAYEGRQNSKESGFSLPPDWKTCMTCHCDCPPRAHHCRLCHACIFKRDHHCYFTGTCIGFGNQRRFIVWAFYVACGSLYGIILILWFLRDQKNRYWSNSLWEYIPCVAFWRWTFGYLWTSNMCLLLELYFCIMIFVISTGFFGWQMYLVFTGQTYREAMSGDYSYNMGVIKNFNSVFGPFWFMNFILPLPTVQLGDGLNWKRKKVS